MKITIISVGKLKEEYLKEANRHFTEKISKLCDFETIEIPDERISENASLSEINQIKEKEGTGILKKIKAHQFVIALAIDGIQLDTKGLRKKIIGYAASEKNDIVFIIGGSLGLSDSVLKRANYQISFSPMTFPHQLMKIMLLEQILMCLTNNTNKKYK